MPRSNTTKRSTQSMREISHTNPHTGETVGQLFSRGPTVATDGGERTDGDRRSETDQSAATDATDRTETMKDVSHTPPHDAEDANEVFERGREYGRKHERGTDV